LADGWLAGVGDRRGGELVDAVGLAILDIGERSGLEGGGTRVRSARSVLRPGDGNWSSVAPSLAGVRDPRAGPGRSSLEVFASSCRCGVSGVVGRVVVVELALRVVRHQLEDADVPVGHDRAPGSGHLIDTAVA
jgi:hypothetical protein